MQAFYGFKRYVPTDAKKQQLGKRFNLVFLCADTGDDWYDCQATFSPETTKLLLDSDNRICAITQDVSALYPEGKSVIEVESLPQGCDIHGHWFYVDGEILSQQDNQAEEIRQAEINKQRLLNEAAHILTPLQDAVDLKLATQQEQQRLLAWKRYRLALMHLDITQSDIVWPTVPKEDEMKKSKPAKWFGRFARR